MKKTILLCSLAGLITGFSYSQVGINTENPKGTLHIDAKADNGAVNPPTAISDDVIVTSTGTVGVGGILAPATKLDVKGTSNATIRLADGSQQNGHMLGSINDDGIAKWIAKPETVIISGKLNDSSGNFGTLPASATPLTTTAPNGTQPNGGLTLSPGKWLIVAKLVTTTTTTPNQNIWIYLKQQLASDAINNSGTGTFINVIGAVPEASGSNIGTPQMIYIVNIPDGQSYRYEIWASTSNANVRTTTQFQGSIFYAVRLDQNTL